MLQIVASLSKDSTYDCNVFIVQDTVVKIDNAGKLARLNDFLHGRMRYLTESNDFFSKNVYTSVFMKLIKPLV